VGTYQNAFAPTSHDTAASLGKLFKPTMVYLLLDIIEVTLKDAQDTVGLLFIVLNRQWEHLMMVVGKLSLLAKVEKARH